MANSKEIPTMGGSITISDHQIYGPGGDYIGTINNYGHIAGADGKQYFVNNYGTVTETTTGRFVGQVLSDGTYMPAENSSTASTESSSQSSSGSTMSTVGAIALVLLWLFSVSLADTIAMMAILLVLAFVMLASFAFPSLGELLMRTELYSEFIRTMEEVAPKTIEFLRTPETAQKVLAVGVGLTLLIVILDLIGMMRVFRRKEINPLYAFVPLANTYELCKAAGGGALMFILQLIPCVQLFAAIWMYIRLAEAFGRSRFYAILLILFRPLFLILLPRGRK